ncbi:MAG: hypothetical protein KDD45_10040 [Bdellovibrionales bacterium]|nr:hypothetical protein [Bdellovibrionales bacterium]
MVSRVIASKCLSLGETIFYEVKDMVNRIFGFEMNLKYDRLQNYSTYQKILRKRCEDIKKYIKSIYSNYEDYPKIDKYVKNEKLSFGNNNDISGKEYHLILIFNWMCLGLY